MSECPIKPDSARVIKEMKDSDHLVKMITGDNMLTAAYIGEQLKFGDGTQGVLQIQVKNEQVHLLDLEDKLV